jgi:hypothetical protein
MHLQEWFLLSRFERCAFDGLTPGGSSGKLAEKMMTRAEVGDRGEIFNHKFDLRSLHAKG